MAPDDSPMSLNELLQFLTTNGLSGSQAMKVTPALIKQSYNSKYELSKLSDAVLVRLGFDDKETKKALLTAAKRAKLPPKASPRKYYKKGPGRDSDLDRPLEEAPSASSAPPSYDITEQLDDYHLETASCVINRAPVMCAWATVVAERLSFTREEALSLAQGYTEANAQSRAASLGISKSSSSSSSASPDKGKSVGAGTQPYVELMGRKVPVLGLQDGTWRAVSGGKPIEPDRAFKYLKNSFQQQLGQVVGALRLLGDSFEPAELNEKGYGLYSEFRPEATGWGQKSELKYSTILNLRRHLTHVPKEEPVEEAEAAADTKPAIKEEEGADLFKPEPDDTLAMEEEVDKKPDVSKLEPKAEDEDEFDRMLENDDLDFSSIPA